MPYSITEGMSRAGLRALKLGLATAIVSFLTYLSGNLPAQYVTLGPIVVFAIGFFEKLERNYRENQDISEPPVQTS